MPPVAVTVAEPVLPVLQAGLVAVAVAVTTVGATNVTEEVAVHPRVSVTVTVYVPAPRLLMVAVLPTAVVPLRHWNVYPGVPPATVTLADPVFPVLQAGFVEAVVGTTGAGAVSVADDVPVHPLESVTVTV